MGVIMKRRIVKNYPSPRLMDTIGATNQSIPEAIGELVANSFDARVGQNPITINIYLKDNSITIIDNGRGMTDNILEKAVCIAEDMSKYIERGEGTKGHFGMGFKTSCSTLGKFYEIFTRPLNGSIEHHVEFDIEEYSKRPNSSEAWDVEIETSNKFDNSPLTNLEHGTAFVIKNLRTREIMYGAILDYLGEAFKGHLITEDKIYLFSKENVKYTAQPKKYNFVAGSEIKIDESFKDSYGNEHRITGWMAIDSITHNNGCYGFNIYRNNQLLEKWNKDWFKPHLMTSRIIGDVNMDFLEATFYKQGKQQSELWLEASNIMKDFLPGIASASREISKQGNINKPAERKRIIKKLNEDYGLDTSNLDVKINGSNTNLSANNNNEPEQNITNSIKGYVKEKSLVLDDYGEVKISYLQKEEDKAIVPFDYIFDDVIIDDNEDFSAELQVILYSKHPLWNKRVDSEIQKIVATADAIYRMLVEKLSYDTSDALKIRTEWFLTKFNIDKREDEHE